MRHTWFAKRAPLALVLSAALTGCLSSGGGGDDAPPPATFYPLFDPAASLSESWRSDQTAGGKSDVKDQR